MAMALHTLTDDLAFQNVEGCEQGRGAMTFVVSVRVPARLFFIGRPGWVRSSAWIWLFSSIDRTWRVYRATWRRIADHWTT
jgi:hypothetical protein